MDDPEHTRLSGSDLTPEMLKGITVFGADGEAVGAVSHLHGSGAASQLIIDVGGFLGIGTKPVVVALGQLEFMRNKDGKVHAVTNWTKDQIRAMPEHRE